MRKYSKSDQDPHQTDRDAAALAEFRKTKSHHFAWGTKVMMNNRRYTLNQTIGSTVILIADDGTAHRIDNPYFMQWRA